MAPTMRHMSKQSEQTDKDGFISGCLPGHFLNTQASLQQEGWYRGGQTFYAI